MRNRNSTARLISLLALVVTTSRTNAPPTYMPYAFGNFVGLPGGPGTNDGTGSAARFNLPQGVAVDSAGNVYVADTGNNTIRKITPAGAVTTLAGSSRQSGSADGTGTAARFNTPSAVAVDSTGNVYVADTINNTIRKIVPAGVVTTLAGSSGQSGSADGTGTAALFNAPSGVAVDSTVNVYVADTGNGTIRTITPAGMVTTMAGGSGSASLFNTPSGVTVDSAGNVYVSALGANLILKVTPAGAVATLAGCAGQGACPSGSSHWFSSPTGVTVDRAGNLYVADTGYGVIRKITPGGAVTTLAGSAGQSGSADGTGTAAQFNSPAGLAVDSAGNVYVADTGNNTIRKITPAAAVTTLAGNSGYGSANGTGTAARFNNPFGVAVDGSDNVYVADIGNNTIRRITPGGAVTTVAGSAGQAGSADGIGSAALFNVPYGVAVDGAGNVYVADGGNDTIRKIVPSGAVTTLAGSAGQIGISDGIGSAAQFWGPAGVAVDGAGNIYVADTGNNTIRKITSGGAVTTVAGSPGPGGSDDGTGYAARFHYPYGVGVDSAGNVYVADEYNSTIRRIMPGGVVTTLAGSAGQSGSADGPGSAARFAYPTGVAVDSVGNVYVVDSGNSTIRKITPAGVVTTLAGSAAQLGSDDGTGSAARFTYPFGVAVDSRGNLYVADAGNNRISKGTPLLQFDDGVGSLTVSNSLLEMRLAGPPSNNVLVEESANLQTWTPLQTNALSPDGLKLSVPVGTNQRQFFRARLAP